MSGVVIIPVLNELDNLKILIPKLVELEEDFYIMIIDDSKDFQTSKWLENEMKIERIIYSHRTSEKGFSSALAHGYKLSSELGVEWAIQMDGDCTHSTETVANIRKMLKKKSANLILSNRWASSDGIVNIPLHRKILSRIARLYCRFILGKDVNDWTSGLRGMDSQTLKFFANLKLNHDVKGYAFQAIMAKNAISSHRSVMEVPTVLNPRENGNSKITLYMIIEGFISIMFYKKIIKL